MQAPNIGGYNKSANGMSYILVMNFIQIITDSGGSANTLIDQALFLAFEIRALVINEKRALERVEKERDELFNLQLEYSYTYDDSDSYKAGQKNYKQLVMLSVQTLFEIACEYDLINPSLLNEVGATKWKDFAKSEG
jgi:hypothetical protein